MSDPMDKVMQDQGVAGAKETLTRVITGKQPALFPENGFEFEINAVIQQAVKAALMHANELMAGD